MKEVTKSKVEELLNDREIPFRIRKMFEDIVYYVDQKIEPQILSILKDSTPEEKDKYLILLESFILCLGKLGERVFQAMVEEEEERGKDL